MNPSPPDVIGIVGLGLVGTALAQRLRAAGFQPLGYDLREEARAAFAAQGFQVASTLGEIGAAAACAVLAVFETRDVLGVVEGPGGLLSGGAVRNLIDCSTGDPDALSTLATRLAASSVNFIEAPLSGSSQQIEAGQATMLLGGETAAIDGCAAVLEALAGHRLHLGGAGMGARAKLATNLVLGLNRAALAEGMVFAETLGIAPAQFLALVLATPATSGAAQAKGAMMVEGRFEPQSRIRQHFKDVRLMIASAAAAGQKLPLSETHAALMRSAIEAGDGELDNAAIVRELRRRKS